MEMTFISSFLIKNIHVTAVQWPDFAEQNVKLKHTEGD